MRRSAAHTIGTDTSCGTQVAAYRPVPRGIVSLRSLGWLGVWTAAIQIAVALVFGLARYRVNAGAWQYLALPGALLYFVENRLEITSRRYLRDENYERINKRLDEQLRAEESELRATKESLHRMEEEFFRRVWEMRRERR